MSLEDQFDEAMLEIYRRALSECKYNATRFLQMVNQHGGLQAAKTLINAPTLSDGFTALWQCGRLDLTVEAVALDPKWRDLFSDEELARAKKRLVDLNYKFE